MAAGTVIPNWIGPAVRHNSWQPGLDSGSTRWGEKSCVARVYEIRFFILTVAEPSRGDRKEPDARHNPKHVIRLVQSPLLFLVKRMRMIASAQVTIFLNYAAALKACRYPAHGTKPKNQRDKKSNRVQILKNGLAVGLVLHRVPRWNWFVGEVRCFSHVVGMTPLFPSRMPTATGRAH